MRTHVFKDKLLGKGIPHGVYDLAHDEGWVSVGIDHDAASSSRDRRSRLASDAMHVVLALALRRVALMGAGIASVLAAHALAMGGLQPQRSAPLMWGFFLLGAGMCGGRRRFRPRSYASIAALLVGLQTLLHGVLVVAPWSLGLSPDHHPVAVIDVRSFTVHAVAALLLALVLRRADLVLALLSAVTEAVARTMANRPRRAAGPRRAERVRVHVAPLHSAATRSSRTSRGPPRGLLRPALAASLR